MKDDAGKSGVALAIGLILLLLLSIGGVVFFAVSRQQSALALEAERAELAEAQARMAARLGGVRAETAHERTSPTDAESSIGESAAIRAAVESILHAQEDAWNAGNLDAFMEHYWKSEDLTFSSGGKTTRSWNATLNRYRDRYATPEQMGRLSLSGLEITPLGESAALVLGQWNLERESAPLSGNFSLVVRKFDDRWQIIHDHTSQTMD